MHEFCLLSNYCCWKAEDSFQLGLSKTDSLEWYLFIRGTNLHTSLFSLMLSLWNQNICITAFDYIDKVFTSVSPWTWILQKESGWFLQISGYPEHRNAEVFKERNWSDHLSVTSYLSKPKIWKLLSQTCLYYWDLWVSI